jgi:hypothetical protein
MTFPVALSGSAWRNSTYLGALKPAILVLAQVMSSSAVTPSCLRTMNALPTWPEALVGDADDGGLVDGWVLHQEALDLGRVGVEAADDEHVLLPADDLETAVLSIVPRSPVCSQPPESTACAVASGSSR